LHTCFSFSWTLLQFLSPAIGLSLLISPADEK
jgi:hypothetical protein